MRQRILWLALAVAVSQDLAAVAATPPRLNVLWIVGDDHAAHAVGCYGNRRVRTPNLDRLAAGGMRFDRAFCNSPVCTASRQSFITGRYPRTIGVTELQTALPAKEQTLANMLKPAGYVTAAIGKMHFNSQLKHGFDLRRDLGEYDKVLALRGPKPLPPNIDVAPPWRPFEDAARVWLNSSVRPYWAVDADMDGTYFADQAEQFLLQPHDSPFFLFVGFYEPHAPFHFPVEDRGKYDPSKFPIPVCGPEDASQIPAVFSELTPSEKQGIAAAYYTSIEFMDRNVGRVLAALDKSGQADHTLVIYTGDHGYLLGQHGRFEKHCSYEEAIRSPLMIRFPGTVPARSATSALVEFVDIVPTVLDLCGVTIPSTVQGRSFVPLLKGERPSHRSRVFVEYAPNEEAAVRDERWKLIFERGQNVRADGYAPATPPSGHVIRLFDLENDPAEMHNVADSPENAERVRQMLAQLAEHLKSTAREPEFIPQTDDPVELLDFCVQTDDIGQRRFGPTPRLRWPFLLATFYALLVAAASLAASWLPLRVRLTHTRVQLAMSACGGLMLGVGVFHLLPLATTILISLDQAVGWLLTGLLTMFLLIRAFPFHRHEPGPDQNSAGAGDLPSTTSPPMRARRGVLAGLAIHTLIGGLALAASVQADAALGKVWVWGIATFIAILVHTPLDATAMSFLVTGDGNSGRPKRLATAGLALLCPLGVVLFFLVIKRFALDRFPIVGCTLSFSAGVFFCIALSDLLPELEFHSHDRTKLSLALVLGIGLAFVLA